MKDGRRVNISFQPKSEQPDADGSCWETSQPLKQSSRGEIVGGGASVLSGNGVGICLERWRFETSLPP